MSWLCCLYFARIFFVCFTKQPPVKWTSCVYGIQGLSDYSLCIFHNQVWRSHRLSPEKYWGHPFHGYRFVHLPEGKRGILAAIISGLLRPFMGKLTVKIENTFRMNSTPTVCAVAKSEDTHTTRPEKRYMLMRKQQ